MTTTTTTTTTTTATMCSKTSTTTRGTDEDPQQRPPSAYANASFLSRLFFEWPYPMLKLGLERPLDANDLPDIMQADGSRACGDYLWNLWKDQQKRENPRLERAIIYDFYTKLWYWQPIVLLSIAARVMQAVALGNMVESFETTGGKGFVWAGVLLACSMIVLFEHHHVFADFWHRGMRLRTASIACIYDKSLKLSSTQHDISASSGKILNLASNDVERYLRASLFTHYLFWAPLQTVAIMILGVYELGVAFLVGVALLLLVVVPLQTYLARKFAQLRSKVAAITDQRVNLVSQAVYGARVMKMNGWEWQFLDRIQAIRQREVLQIQRANSLKGWNEALFFTTNGIVSVVIFLTHIAIGGTLSPRTLFTVLNLVNILQVEMTKRMSLGVMCSSECYVSIKRIQAFLEFPELPETTRNEETKALETGRVVSMRDVTCYWNEVRRTREAEGEEQEPVDPDTLIKALSNISLEFSQSSLTCIIGVVGSGKSALLQAIVGELPVASGTIKRNYGSISYASQDPWIMGGTVKENIVMGLPWDPEWYDRVVSACGLNVDFQHFRSGDETIVGDRGVQCSGGQRARIGLARTLYKDADVLVCDDPLSAVDPKVGRLIFHEAIMKLAVKRGKCVILATHQHQYLSDERCVLVSHGRIECDGTYAECVEASGGKLNSGIADSSVDEVVKEEANPDVKVSVQEFDKAGAEDGKEMNVTGLVRMETFIKYAQAMGGIWVGLLMLLLFAATQTPALVTIFYLGRWSERSEADQKAVDIILLISGLALLVLFLAIVRALISFRLTVLASRRLHDRMTKTVLRAKVEFFDTNPVGRILNRFSADVGSNDDLLPHTLYDFLMIAFVVVGALLSAVVSLPFTLIAVPPLVWYFMSTRRIFVTTTRELKRLEGLARSPIFAMLSESLSGIATVRSNGYLPYFRKRFEEVHNGHTRAFFAFISSSRWFGFRMDAILTLFVGAASFLAVLFDEQEWFAVDPALFGLALSMLVQLSSAFQWCIRQSAEVINQMVSVERVLGFSDIPSEDDLEKESDRKLGNWPTRGDLVVKDLSVRYRDSLPLALNGVSFEVPPGSRVGVVGRTGSGKSTLVQAVFRLLEAENGSIVMDSVNIAQVGLHSLRTKLSVIPQVPVLFSGCTVRENLDPFASHTNEKVVEALRDVHMLEAIEELPAGLQSMVAEGGSNFSVGQRQLLCLARAILRKNKFLILDEPTANVDRRTDELLQAALVKSFPDATIISVAHRLETIIDNDLVLVMGRGGKVLEYGSPAELIAKEDGQFANMVKDTGVSMAAELTRRASSVKPMR